MTDTIAAATDITQLSLADTARAYRDGSLSPVEVVGEFVARAQAHPQLHAYVDLYAEQAIQQARASEARLRQGIPFGLLEGIPLAIKDLIDIEGRRTTAGSSIYATRELARGTATVAQRLHGAGAITLGKVHMVELAFGGWGVNQGAGTPRNPWDSQAHRVPGGSSSGSGVAVAAGLASAALGTDTGGSVRIPAAFCGLTGLKPTEGRVSKAGVTPLSTTLDSVGPMTWTAEDAAWLLQVMQGPDAADPATLQPPVRDFLAALGQPLRGLRIACATPQHYGSVHPAVEQGLRHVAEVFEGLHATRCDEAFPALDFSADQHDSSLIMAAEGYAAHGELLAAGGGSGDPGARGRIEAGRAITAAQYIRALDQRTQRRQLRRAIFDTVDLLVLPTVSIPAALLGDAHEADPTPSRLTRFVNYYGWCALAMPCGHDEQGLPVSVQLVAAPYREDLLLRAASAFQAVTAHHTRRPAL